MYTDLTASMVSQRRADLQRQAQRARLEKAARTASAQTRKAPAQQAVAPRRSWSLGAVFSRTRTASAAV